MIKKYLDDLENRVDVEKEKNLFQEWIDFSDKKITAGVFNPSRKYQAAPGIEWPEILINHTMNDIDKSILRDLKISCSDMLNKGSGSLLCVRPNYGTGTLPSAFGAELFYLEDELNTLPITKHVEENDIRKIISRGVPGISKGLMGKVFDTAHRMKELLHDYPKLKAMIHIYHPDFQGPMDIAELLYGSGIFTDIYLKPELIKELLELSTETYIFFLKEWFRIFLDPDVNHSIHWGMMHRGHTMIRNDSAMNMPPDIFEEFIFPYDKRILDTFGGGAIHFCGRGVHYIEQMSAHDNLHAINITQPECNDDMEHIYQHTIDKGIALIGLYHGAVEKATETNRNLRGLVHDQGENPSFDIRKK